MEQTTIELKDLPPRLVQAIVSATPSELIIVDNQVLVARIVLCAPSQPRSPSLHPGAFTTTDDFDAPLADEFWMGAP